MIELVVYTITHAHIAAATLLHLELYMYMYLCVCMYETMNTEWSRNENWMGVWIGRMEVRIWRAWAVSL